MSVCVCMLLHVCVFEGIDGVCAIRCVYACACIWLECIDVGMLLGEFVYVFQYRDVSLGA